MPARAIHYTVSADQADYVETLIASGAYASPEDVINAGLHALRSRDAEIDLWLNTEVADAYDALQANPALSVSAEEVFAGIRAEHADRMKKRASAV